MITVTQKFIILLLLYLYFSLLSRLMPGYLSNATYGNIHFVRVGVVKLIDVFKRVRLPKPLPF